MKASEVASSEPSAIPAKADAPLVSCIMPTNGRADWLPQAIRLFQRQTYPNLELVIVDSRPGATIPETSADSRIRRLQAPANATIGAMRNLACQQARGEVVIQWDDDDWYAADRVDAQVRPILDGRADITALKDALFLELDRWAFWRCEPELIRRMFVLGVLGGTLAYRRSIFSSGVRYPERSLAEDAAFLCSAVDRGARLTPLPGEALFVYLRHAANTWSFICGAHLDPAGWSNAPEPPAFAADRTFYAARSRTARHLPVTAPGSSGVAADPGRSAGVAIGVHVHAEPSQLEATLAAIEANTPPGFELWLLSDAPDDVTRASLARLSHIAQTPTGGAPGAPACFNRLAEASRADLLVLLESGAIVGPGWLSALSAALTADPAHGIASPSTNFAWNQLAVFPRARTAPADVAATAAEARRRFGDSWRKLTPLWDVGDFCMAVRREVIEAVGPADEAYGQGPCWEMDYAVRAARAGFDSVWARGAYVYRHPLTPRRQREEALQFEANRRRYQDKFCGLRLSGGRTTYATHCRGEDCAHFAPPEALVRGPQAPAAVAQSDKVWAVSSPPPLASCIMPTANRRMFVSHAIAQFLAQDYPACELVILDDGQDPVGDLVPAHPAVRYIRAAPFASLGRKRNAACEAARGRIILHWDDDDWYAPQRVRTQVEALLANDADLCGVDRVFFLDPRGPEGWEYVYPRGGMPWVAGATMCYSRDFWRANPFADVTVGEDNLFAAAARPQRLHVLSDNRFFVALVHAANTSPKQVRDPRWQPRDAAAVRALTGPDWPPPAAKLESKDP